MSRRGKSRPNELRAHSWSWPLLFALAVLTAAGCSSEPGVFTLDSPDISGGQLTAAQTFNGFNCNGPNVSPALRWSNPPAGTKSFAITMFDPDAPTGSG